MKKIKFEINLDQGYYDALMIIISEEYPYADDRDLSPVFEAFIDEYLLREGGRLGHIERLKDGSKWGRGK